MDITAITDKFSGTDHTFDPNDHNTPECRLKLNRVLRELATMGWIDLQPTNGLSTSHHLNHSTMRREFILDMAVRARLTTTGEIEYKKMIQPSIAPTTPVSSVIIGDNFSGNFAQHNSGITHQTANHSDPEGLKVAKKGLSIGRKQIWVAIIIGLVSIAVAILIAEHYFG